MQIRAFGKRDVEFRPGANRAGSVSDGDGSQGTQRTHRTQSTQSTQGREPRKGAKTPNLLLFFSFPTNRNAICQEKVFVGCDEAVRQ